MTRTVLNYSLPLEPSQHAGLPWAENVSASHECIWGEHGIAIPAGSIGPNLRALRAEGSHLPLCHKDHSVSADMEATSARLLTWPPAA